MIAYDRWLEGPAVDVPEGVECPDCGGTGKETPGPGSGDCKTCEGEGVVSPPTREEIEERKAEERFDQLRDEGRI